MQFKLLILFLSMYRHATNNKNDDERNAPRIKANYI